MMPDSNKLTFVDLFCGCGGMSAGFKKAGFIPLMGVDILKDAVATYSMNIGAPALDIGMERFIGDLRAAIGASAQELQCSN